MDLGIKPIILLTYNYHIKLFLTTGIANMTHELRTFKCTPCDGGTEPMGETEIAKYLHYIEGWEVKENHHLVKLFMFKDFKEALAFTNKIGELAENEGHHPDIYLAWGRVYIVLWTHKISGLSLNDFIFAAKSDALFQSL